jgi:hypothetical protein
LAPFISLLRRFPHLVIPALTERATIADIRRILAPHPYGANASVVQICSLQICPCLRRSFADIQSANPSLHSSIRLKNNVPDKVKPKKQKTKTLSVFKFKLWHLEQ